MSVEFERTPNDRARTHLSRIGVNPAVVARLIQYADADGMTLAEMVRYVLSDYTPPDALDRQEQR